MNPREDIDAALTNAMKLLNNNEKIDISYFKDDTAAIS